MSWNYDYTQLATSAKDRVRLEIGDTDPTNQMLQDEEINQAISVENNFWGASARCCEMIARVKLGHADIRLGRAMYVTYTKMADQYLRMAVALREKALGANIPYAGGVVLADKQTLQSDTSIVQPAFTREMQENPRTGGYTSDTIGDVAGAPPGVVEEF